VRRSRRRFWKSASDQDKLGAYQTLHAALVTVSRLLAPFTPFVAEELYRNLARGDGTADSVHLETWPVADIGAMDEALLHEMARARRIVEMGHKERDRAGLKVRQPLAGATVPGPALAPELEEIVLDELNLKSLAYAAAGTRGVALDTAVTPELRLEGLAREIVRRLQGARRDADLHIEDRIEVRWRAEGELAEAMRAWAEHVAAETLATSLTPADGDAGEGWFVSDGAVEGAPLWLALRRVGGDG
jgi:isoleucyl-tRNA synthetase